MVVEIPYAAAVYIPIGLAMGGSIPSVREKRWSWRTRSPLLTGDRGRSSLAAAAPTFVILGFGLSTSILLARLGPDNRLNQSKSHAATIAFLAAAGVGKIVRFGVWKYSDRWHL